MSLSDIPPRVLPWSSFDDDLVGADAVHLVVHALALAVQLAFDAEDGEFVGTTRTRHPGCRDSAGAVGQHLGGVLFSFRNRRGRWRTREAAPPADKIARAFGAIVAIITHRPVMGSLRSSGNYGIPPVWRAAVSNTRLYRGGKRALGVGEMRFNPDMRRAQRYAQSLMSRATA